MASGSVRQKHSSSGRLFYEVVVRLPDPTTGKPMQRTKLFDRKRDADKHLRTWLAEIEAGTAVAPSRQTVAEMLRAWLAGKRHDLSPTTLDGYTATIEREIIPALGHVTLQRLTPAMLKDFYTRTLDAKRAKGHDGARVVQLCHLRLKQALDEAVDLGLVPRNPAEKVTPPRVTRKQAETWTPEETARFLAAASKSFYGPVWALLAATGMRRGEALGLRWADVDVEAGAVSVVQTNVSVKGAPLLKETPKTTSSRRTIPVHPAVMRQLKEHRRRQTEQRLRVGAAWQDRDLVFCTGLGKPINANNLQRDRLKWIAAAGVRRIRIHDIRHSYASQALQAGADIKAVSEVLGHAKTSITMDIYAHVTKKQHADVAARVGAGLFGDDAQAAL